MREQRPHQGKHEAVPDGREQQDVHVLLTELPIRPVQKKIHFPCGVEGESETGEHTVWELELHEAEQTLRTNRPRPRQLDMILQRGEHDAPSLDHRQHERGQNHQTAGIQGKSRLPCSLQGIVRGSALGWLHRRNTLQEPAFCVPPPVLKSSQPSRLGEHLGSFTRVWAVMHQPSILAITDCP